MPEKSLSEKLDTTIVKEGGLALRVVEEKVVIGGNQKEYFAILHFNTFDARRHIPTDVEYVKLEEIEIEISERMYNHLIQLRKDGSAYGRITIEPYVRSSKSE